jgi:hypothetical protein
MSRIFISRIFAGYNDIPGAPGVYGCIGRVFGYRFFPRFNPLAVVLLAG